jgi:hypothetical protein
MNVYGASDYSHSYVKFLEITRTEMYYHHIDPISDILNNGQLNSEGKIKLITEVHAKFMETINSWDIDNF